MSGWPLTIAHMTGDREELLRRYTESIYRTPPALSQSDVNMVSLKLITALQRYDLRADIASRIRVILPCRVLTGNLRAPKVLFVVMDDAVAVLGPIHWSGYLKPAPHPLDVILPWSQVGAIGFMFPEPWGPLPTPASKKFRTETGKHLIVFASSAGKTIRIMPDAEQQSDFSRIARFTGTVLDRFERAQMKTPEVDHATRIRGLLRYLPDLQKSSTDDRVILSCSLIQENSLLNGYLVIAGGTFGFFDYFDCLVDDIDDGNPLAYPLDAITGCTVMKPEQFYVAPRVAVEVQSMPRGEDAISVLVEVEGVELPFALSAGRDLDSAGRQSIEQDLGKCLGLVDRGILLH